MVDFTRRKVIVGLGAGSLLALLWGVLGGREQENPFREARDILIRVNDTELNQLITHIEYIAYHSKAKKEDLQLGSIERTRNRVGILLGESKLSEEDSQKLNELIDHFDQIIAQRFFPNG